MADKKVEAFILFNEREQVVASIVNDLDSRDVTTHFWRRDVKYGDDWEQLERERLEDAGTVLIFLGKAGWGTTHLRFAGDALRLSKRIIPVLIGDPPPDAFDEAGAMFKARRYLDMRSVDKGSLDELFRAIRQIDAPNAKVANAGQFDRVVEVLVDGNEEQRADTLRQIQTSTSLDKTGLAARLRKEILERFSPSSQSNFALSRRDPKKIPSIRSWMLSALIVADVEGEATRELVRTHLQQSFEPERNVRFWALATLYQCKASWLSEVLTIGLSDSEPDVAMLASAIASPDDFEFKRRLETQLHSPEFVVAWQALRVLRVFPITDLVGSICEQLGRKAGDEYLTYDALYALSQSPMALEAVPILLKSPSLDGLLEMVIATVRNSNANAARNFVVLLAAFDPVEMERALSVAEQVADNADAARRLRRFLLEFRRRDGERQLFVAGYTSDTLDITFDPLDIAEDVQTLTAVMLAQEIKPPLAIGLFGDWGSGKSYFMKSMQSAARKFSSRPDSGAAKFCHHIVQIEFNAWHYADTNLWASLVSYILEQLAAHVSPQPTPEEQQAQLTKELTSAKTIVSEAEAEKKQTEELVKSKEIDLQKLQKQRQERELELSELRVSDLKTLLSGEATAELNKELKASLEQVGISDAVNSFSDLSSAVSEAHSVRGRAAALLLGFKGNSCRSFLLLLGIILLLPPVAYYGLRYVMASDFISKITAITAPLTSVVITLAVMLRKAVGHVKQALEKLEAAKQKVDALLAEKRKKRTPREIELEKEIASLKTKEQETLQRVSAGTARVLELEERIRSLKDGRSLAHFLGERTKSDDYRKHLGLISTIRQDFDSLATRLDPAKQSEGNKGLKPVDRIILYIDDLDRCPADKVLEVLQAVHLILAYPLFVVVVGVDPRWLLHSLGESYSAFQNGKQQWRDKKVQTGNGQMPAHGDVWRTTPQNYLEKIFQIPFSLQPMTVPGFSNLIHGLLCPGSKKADQENEIKKRVTNAGDEDYGGKKGENETKDNSKETSGTGGGNAVSGVKTLGADAIDGTRDSGRIRPEPPVFVIDDEALTIKSWEGDFAEKLFALIPTPRATKRFSNIYRILKAPIRRDRLTRFEGTAELPGEFQVPMLLLAILMGSPAEAAALFPQLLQRASNGSTLKQSLQEIEASGGVSPEFKLLAARIHLVLNDRQFPDSVELLLEWLPRVSRFSFDVGQAMRGALASSGPLTGTMASSRAVHQ